MRLRRDWRCAPAGIVQDGAAAVASGLAVMAMSMAELWIRQSGEPGRWFSRFETYRLLGPRRTLEAAFDACKKSEGLTGGRPGTQWYEIAKQWDWKRRAEAWDDVERAAFLESERARRLDARRRRLEIIEATQEAAYVAILAARLDALNGSSLVDVNLARDLLPSTRLLLSDALKAQRLEYGESTEIVEAGIDLTADDLHAAMADLEAWRSGRNGDQGMAEVQSGR